MQVTSKTQAVADFHMELLLKEAYDQVKGMVQRNRAALDVLVDALLADSTIRCVAANSSSALGRSSGSHGLPKHSPDFDVHWTGRSHGQAVLSIRSPSAACSISISSAAALSWIRPATPADACLILVSRACVRLAK